MNIITHLNSCHSSAELLLTDYKISLTENVVMNVCPTIEIIFTNFTRAFLYNLHKTFSHAYIIFSLFPILFYKKFLLHFQYKCDTVLIRVGIFSIITFTSFLCTKNFNKRTYILTMFTEKFVLLHS